MRSMQYEKTKEKTEGDAAQRYKGIKESNKVRRKNRMFVKSEEGSGGRGREMKRQSEGHIVWFFLRNKENASTEACSAASAPKEVGHFKDTHTCAHTCTHRMGRGCF